MFVHNFKGLAYQGYLNWRPIFFDGAVEEITGYGMRLSILMILLY
jgi:hypothetical protein